MGTTNGPAALTSSSSTMAPIDVKTHSVAESDVTGMTAAEIMQILHGLAPEEMAAAGAAHTKLGTTLEQIATRVAQHAHTLAQSWTGSAAQAAMVRFQALHDQTATLAQQATQTGAVLSWLGNEVLPKFKSLPDPTPASPMAADAQVGAAAGEQAAGPGGAVLGAAGGAVFGAVSGLFGGNAHAQEEANHTAQQYLRALNGYLVQANEALPSPVGGSTALSGGSPGAVSPSGGSHAGAGGMVPASGYPGSAGSGAGAGTGTVPGSGTGTAGVPSVGPLSGAGGSGAGLGTAPAAGHGGVPGAGSPAPSTGSLQSVPVTPGSSLSSPTGTSVPPPTGLGTGSPGPGVQGLSGLSVPSPGPAGAVAGEELPAVPGVDSTLSGGEALAPDVPGLTAPGAVTQGAVADAAVGTSATPDGALAAGAEGEADYGMTGFPMTGSGSAEREKERRRQAWLDEDPDIWGLPSDHVPAVIEGGG
jgi:hypothetical protein